MDDGVPIGDQPARIDKKDLERVRSPGEDPNTQSGAGIGTEPKESESQEQSEEQ